MAALSFSLTNATPETYKAFIEALRHRLTAGRPTSHGIPVLPRREDVQPQQRFILVNLTNYANVTITVAIDVVDVYVVGYATGGRSYFLQDSAQNQPPIHTLFPGTRRTNLHFSGTYRGLSQAARDAVQQNTHARNRAGSSIHDNVTMHERIPLGRNELNSAISQLSVAGSESDQAAALIVIIQMLSEAVRFRFIEGQVRTSMRAEYDPFTPGPAMRSLETHWSDLSEQIQRVPVNQTRFNRTVVLQNIRDERVEVSSVDSDIVRGVALLLYDRNRNNSNPGPPAGKMPKPDAALRPKPK